MEILSLFLINMDILQNLAIFKSEYSEKMMVID